MSSTAGRKPEIAHHDTSPALYEQTAELMGAPEFDIKCKITAKKINEILSHKSRSKQRQREGVVH